MERCPNITLYLKQSKNIQLGPVKTFVMLKNNILIVVNERIISIVKCGFRNLICSVLVSIIAGRKVKFCFRYRSQVFSILFGTKVHTKNDNFYCWNRILVTIQTSANMYICEHCIAFDHSSIKPGYSLRDLSSTRNKFQVQMVMQKDKFENERLNRLNLPFEQQLIFLQYLLSWIRIRQTKRIYVEIRHGCCNFDVEDRFSIQFKEGL